MSLGTSYGISDRPVLLLLVVVVVPPLDFA